MKVFARFNNEIWCMDLAFVGKLFKDNNGLKYLLVRQDLFDGTIEAKGVKTKVSKARVFLTFRRVFLTLITKNERRPKRIWFDNEQNLQERLKNYSKLKEYKITLKLMTPRLHWLNVHYDP